MSEIDLCEGCTQPTLTDDLIRCNRTGLDYCVECMGHHAGGVHGCGSCAYEMADL